MNTRINLVEALKGRTNPVAKYKYMFACERCGCESYGFTPPMVVACTGCNERVEATENPEYVAPVSRMTLQRADNDTCGNN